MEAASEWHWWCHSVGGRSQVEKAFDALPGDIQGAFFALMEDWAKGELSVDGDSAGRMGQFNVLYLRTRKGNNQFRLYFVQKGNVNVCLEVMYKNQQKIDRATKDTLKSRSKGGASKPID
ncbi:MAG: type II toxin-antitoxin system RelE/ParE family toxin [Arachnia sp.]